jgi:folate-binding protein YgfZ
VTISPAILDQYAALTTGAGVAELARSLVEVTGADRLQLLHSFTTADVKKLPVGGLCEAFVTSPQGKTLGHVLIGNRGQSLVLDTTPGQAAKLIAHFERYIISEDAALADRTAEEAVLLVAGAEAVELLARLGSGTIPREGTGVVQSAIAGQQVLIKRVNFLAAPTYFLQASRGGLSTVGDALAAAGATPCENEAVEMARLEAGTPLFGQDITDDNLPQEIGRDALAISFTKGCYLGQETVARIDALGHVNRQLVGVKFSGTTIPAPGLALRADDKVVGQVTSAAWSPKLQAPLALALVRRAQAKAGTTLDCDGGSAEVVNLPL